MLTGEPVQKLVFLLFTSQTAVTLFQTSPANQKLWIKLDKGGGGVCWVFSQEVLTGYNIRLGVTEEAGVVQ